MYYGIFTYKYYYIIKYVDVVEIFYKHLHFDKYEDELEIF